MSLPFPKNLKSAHKTYGVLTVFAVLIVLFYGNTLFNDFVFEDRVIIEANEYIHSLKYLPKVVTGCLWEFADGACDKTNYPYYRPVQTLSAILTYQISSHPWSFHLVNLLYFFAAASLVYLWTRLLTKKFLLAFLTAILFIIHPINSGVVSWPSALSELTLVIFASLVLIFHVKYRETGSSRNLWLVYLFYSIAILSKEPAILLPIVLVSIDTLFFKISIKRLLCADELKKYLFFAVPLLVYLFMKAAVVGSSLGGSLASFTFLESIHARFTLFAQYLGKLFYPYPLSIFHPFEKSSDFLSFDFFIPFLAAVLFVVFLSVFIKTRKPILTFAFLWFALFLSPVLIFLIGEPDHMLFERFVFVPGIGFSLIAAQVFFYAYNRSPITKYIALAILFFITIISWLIVFPRNTDWKNEEVMYEATLRRSPDAHEIRRNLGELYLKQGEFEKAKTEFEELIRRDESWKDITMAYKGLGDYYRVQGDTETALQYYLQAAETGFSPRDYVTYNDVGVIYMERENYLKGFSYFCQARGLFPASPVVERNFQDALALIDSEYIQKGILHEKIGEEFDKASDENIVYRDKRCDEQSCQYAFSFQAQQFEVLPPFFIGATAASGDEVEITNKGFNPETGIIALQLDSTYKDQTLTFIFPTCRGVRYQTRVSPSY